MKTVSNSLINLIIALGLTPLAHAQFAIETDPATFALKGDSVHIKLSTPHHPEWRLGIGSYSLELPDSLVDANRSNKNQNWHAKIHRAYGVFAEYYFNPNQQGWFVGGQLSQQVFHVNKSHQNTTEFTNSLYMINTGFKWQIKNTAFYVLPWAGIGYTHTYNNKSARQGAGYDVQPIAAFMTMHIGYAF